MAIKMAECTHCKWDYPENLLNPLFIDGGYITGICGICAEELIGIKLHGKQASYMRDMALDWRKKHPDGNNR